MSKILTFDLNVVFKRNKLRKIALKSIYKMTYLRCHLSRVAIQLQICSKSPVPWHLTCHLYVTRFFFAGCSRGCVELWKERAVYPKDPQTLPIPLTVLRSRAVKCQASSLRFLDCCVCHLKHWTCWHCVWLVVVFITDTQDNYRTPLLRIHAEGPMPLKFNNFTPAETIFSFGQLSRFGTYNNKKYIRKEKYFDPFIGAHVHIIFILLVHTWKRNVCVMVFFAWIWLFGAFVLHSKNI